jgi:hypothetical protein
MRWNGSKVGLTMLACSHTRQQPGTIGLPRDQLATVEVYMI